MLLVELNRDILKVHADAVRPGRICAPERAMPDRRPVCRLDHPDPAHDLNPDIAAETLEELNHLRVTLPQGHIMRHLRIGLVHIPSDKNLPEKPGTSPPVVG